MKQNSGPSSSSEGQDGCPRGNQSSSLLPEDATPPEPPKSQIPKVLVRQATSENTKNLSMVVPIEVKGHNTTAVVDGGAQVTIINQGLFEGLKHSGPREPVRLKGIAPTKLMDGYVVRDVLLSLGGRSYRWDLYVAPIDDPFLLVLDFMKHYKVDTLLSRNVLVVNGEYEIPITFKRGISPAGATETYEIGRVTVEKWVVVPPNTVQYIKGKVNKEFQGKGDCVFSPLCAKRGVVLPFTLKHLEENHDGFVTLQVNNLSNNFITFREGYPLGSIKEIDEVIEDSANWEDLSGADQANNVTDETQSSAEGINVRTCAAEEMSTSPEAGSQEGAQSTNAEMSDAQAKLLEVQSQIPGHIKDMFLCSCTHLTDEQSVEFREVLIKFADIFAQHDNDLGLFTATEHTMDTGDAKPIKQWMRRVPLGFADEEEKYLKKMLDSGVIVPSNSDWASPCVLIRKKDGTVHWCIDF